MGVELERPRQYKRAPGFAVHPCVDDTSSKGQADGQERPANKYFRQRFQNIPHPEARSIAHAAGGKSLAQLPVHTCHNSRLEEMAKQSVLSSTTLTAEISRLVHLC